MYQFRDKKQIAKRKILIRNLIITGIVFLIILGLNSPLSKFLNSIGLPIWKSENVITNTVEDKGYLLRTRSSVFRENDTLKNENNNLKNRMIDYDILSKENEQLKELLGRIAPTTDFTLATILTKPNRSPYDTVVVDIGSDGGITTGMRVYADAHIPLGVVSEVYKDSSLVTLYSNPKYITEAVLQQSNTSVELIGRGGGNFEMIIPQDLSSSQGEQVVLPGLNTEVVAIIDGILSAPTDPIKKVILRSPVNVQSLKWVQIKRN